MNIAEVNFIARTSRLRIKFVIEWCSVVVEVSLNITAYKTRLDKMARTSAITVHELMIVFLDALASE